MLHAIGNAKRHAILLIMIFNCYGLFSQAFFENRKILENEINNFLVNYENKLNSRYDFNRQSFLNLFYNDNVEVLNDPGNESEHIPIWEFAEKLEESVNDTSRLILTYHYNLEIEKVNNYKDYDVVHVKLYKEILDFIECAYRASSNNRLLYQIEDSCYTSVDSLHIMMTLMYKKYAKNNKLKILKINRADEDLIVDNWYKPAIPAKIRVETGITLFRLKDEGPFETGSENTGFQIGVSYENRFYGGDDYSVSYHAGFNFATMKNTLSADKYSETDENSVDKDNIAYSRIADGTNLLQTSDFSFFQIPIGITVGYFPFSKIFFEGGVAIVPYYLTKYNYEYSTGSVEYTGVYNINDYPFTFSDIPEYGFTSYNVNSLEENMPFKKYGISWKFTARIGTEITRTIDAFVSTQYETGNLKMETADNNAMLFHDEGKSASMLEMLPETKFNTLNFSVGICINLQNTKKAFIKPPKFKNSIRDTDSKQYFLDQLARQDTLGQQMKNDSALQLIDEYTLVINNNQSGNEGLKYLAKNNLRSIKLDEPEKIKDFGKRPLLIKNFGQEVLNRSFEKAYTGNLYTPVVPDQPEQNISVNTLPPLDIFLTLNRLDREEMGSITDVRNAASKISKNNIENLTNKMLLKMSELYDRRCIFYPYTDTDKSNNIKLFFEETKSSAACESVVDSLHRLGNRSKIVHDFSQSKPTENIINEIRATYFNAVLKNRREMNLHFYINEIYGQYEPGLAYSTSPLNGLEVLIKTLVTDTTLGSVNLSWTNYAEDRNVDFNSIKELKKSIDFKKSTINNKPLRLSDFSNININTTYSFSDDEVRWALNNLFTKYLNEENTAHLYFQIYRFKQNAKNKTKPIQYRNFIFNDSKLWVK
jgi:hypothetical protein